MKNLSKHKIIAIFFGVLYASYIFTSYSNYTSLKMDSDNLNLQINDIMKQNNDLRSRISKNIKLPNNTDISYYATNIYAYALLEGITNVQIKTADSKFGNTLSINLTFNPVIEIEKLKNFVTFVSYLGYVESANKSGITFHVTKYTIEDSKRNLSNKETKND